MFAARESGLVHSNCVWHDCLWPWQASEIAVSVQYLINCAIGSTGSPSFAQAGGDATTFDGCFGGSAYGAYAHMYYTGFVDDSCLPYVAENQRCDALHVCQQNLNQPPNFIVQDGNVPGYVADPRNYPKCPDCRPMAIRPIWYKAAEFGFLAGEEAMQKEIFARGPISCCMSLPDDFLYGYTGGVYVTNASATGLERCQHSVTTVGWGYDSGSGLGYWRVLNSMGTVWGEKGFFRIARNAYTCTATPCIKQ